MRSNLLLALTAAAVVLLSGCASKPQMPVELTPTALSSGSQRVGVAMTALPKVEINLPGADCLLCIIAASAMNSDLSKHADTLGLEDLPTLKERVAAVLRKKGATVVVLPEPLDTKALPDATGEGDNIASKSFAPLKEKYGIDKLVVIEIYSIGFER